MTKVRIGIGDQLPTHAAAIPGRFAQHVMQPLVLAAGDHLGHLLHVSPPTLEKTMEILARRVFDRARSILETTAVGCEVGFEVRKRRSNQERNAFRIFELTS